MWSVKGPNQKKLVITRLTPAVSSPLYTAGVDFLKKMIQGFFHSFSHGVILSTPIQNGGVEKYVDDTSVGSVKNHNQRPADLLGEAINDAKSGKPYHWHSGLR